MEGLRIRTLHICFLNLKNTIFTDYEKVLTTFYPYYLFASVNQLMNNKLIGNKGREIWGGTSENGAQLKTGMYIVFMQVFSEDGEVESYKKVVVLHN